MGEGLKALCDRLRGELLVIEKQARDIIRHPDLEATPQPGANHGEARAQSMLAVRHIEDARMRLGKVLQWSRDGVSTFDTGGVMCATAGCETIMHGGPNLPKHCPDHNASNRGGVL